jgi:hypothetical protein
MPRIALACIAALAIGEAGCAMIMQQAPKEHRAPGEVPVCSTSQGGVVLDSLLATVLGAGALVAFANDEPGVGIGLGAVTGVYTYSAVSGHRSAGACEDAMREYRTEMAARSELRSRPAAPAPAQPVAATQPPVEGPPAPPVEQAPPAEEPVEAAAQEPQPQPPAPQPGPRDWSDFWVEVAR